MKQTFGVFLVKIGIAALFVVTATVTLFFAYGYRFDVEENTVQKTSIIDVVHAPLEADVFLDDRRIAQRVPLQVKGVLPGVHTLRVEKEGFVPWQRSMRVLEDVVTIARDVFLVPEELGEFVEEVLVLEETEQVFYGEDYVLIADGEGRKLRLVELFEDGTFREEEIPLPDGLLATVETFMGQRFLAKFQSGLMMFVSFGERQFKTFRPFDGVDKIVADSGRRLLYFLSDGVLYRLRYDQVNEEEYEYADTVFLTEVEDFFVDANGRVFSVSGGELWVDGVSLLKQQQVLVVPAAVDMNQAVTVFQENQWKSVAVFNGPFGDDLLVLRNVNDERYLFLVQGGYSDATSFRLLTRELAGQPFFFGNGESVYGDREGSVFSLTVSGVKRFAFQMDGPFELLGPYGTDGHFLVQQSGALQVRDVFDAHVVTLFSEFSAKVVARYEDVLFYFEEGAEGMDGGRLNRLMW